MTKLPAVEKGKVNKRRYAEYVSNLELTGKKFPANNLGEVNLSQVAAACGFKRQVFSTNRSMREQLDVDVKRIGKFIASTRNEVKSTVKHEMISEEKLLKTIELKDMEISALKKQVCILQRLLSETEYKAAELNSVFEEILLTGRRFTL